MTNFTATEINNTLQNLANPTLAAHSLRFFKTGPGQYGEGDIFLGIRVPVIRQQVRRFRGTALTEIEQLLISPFHEVRLAALLLLVELFHEKDDTSQDATYRIYLNNTKHINNWDLVDCSAHQIVGTYLVNRSRQTLYNFATAPSLWERRIAIIATFCFIKKDDYNDALEISRLLLQDKEDLIHKAVGWMLREIGKRNEKVERAFLDMHCQIMPRVMLRYAIEKFPEKLRKAYMQGKVLLIE